MLSTESHATVYQANCACLACQAASASLVVMLFMAQDNELTQLAVKSFGREGTWRRCVLLMLYIFLMPAG